MFATTSLHAQADDIPTFTLHRDIDGKPYTTVRPATYTATYIHAETAGAMRALGQALLDAAAEWDCAVRADEIRAAREAVA